MKVVIQCKSLIQLLVYFITIFTCSNANSQVSISPNNQTICLNSNTIIRVLNTQPLNSTYVWQDSSIVGWSTLVSNTNISGVNDDTLSFFNLPSSFNGRKFRCIVDSAGASIRKDTSNVSLINIYNNLTKSIIGDSQTVCFNQSPSIVSITQPSSGGNGIYNYQWQISSNGTLWTDIVSATNLIYSSNKIKSKTYLRVQTTSNCGIIFSDSIILSVYDSITKPIINDNQVICFGFNSDTIRIVTNPTGANNSFNYQWQVSANGLLWIDIPSATKAKFILNNVVATKYIRLKAISNLFCGTVFSDSILIAARPSLQKPTIGTAQNICYNSKIDTIRILQLATGSDGSFNYQWQQSSNGFNWVDIIGQTSLKYISGNLINDIYYRIKATSTINCGNIYSDSVFINVYDKLNPGVLSNNQNICFNSIPSQISFSIPSSGANGNFNYQWQVSIDSINFSNITGATSTVLNLTNHNQTRFYRSIITSVIGCNMDSTKAIRIKVYNPFIGSNSISLQIPLCINTNTDTLSILDLPSGGSLVYTYSWQRSVDSLNWVSIANNNKSKVKLNNLTQTTFIRVITSCNQNCGTDTSETIKVFVYPKLLKPSITSNQSICFNSKPDTILVSAIAQGANGNFNYQWQSSINGQNWTDITGATILKLGLNNLNITTYYRVKATSVYGCGIIYSDSVRVLVYTQLTSGKIRTNQVICYNSIPSLINFENIPTGANGSYAYQWQISNDSIVFVDLNGAININLQPAALLSTQYYRVKVVSNLGCGTVYTNVVKVYVLPQLNAAQIQGAQNVCYDQNATAISITTPPSGADNQFTYQWQFSIDNTNWTDQLNANSEFYVPRRIRSNTYYRLNAISAFGCGQVFSSSVLLTSLPLPDTTTFTGLNTVCKNQQDVYYKLVNSNSVYNYTWMSSGGTILTPTDQTEIYLRFGTNSFVDTLRVLQVNKITGCLNEMKLPVSISNNTAPNKSIILRKPNSNLLFCNDSTQGISYQWGYITKANNQSTDITGANKQYVLLPHTYDTSQYVYFVKTKLNECETKSYFNLVLFSSTDEILAENGINIFPNPVVSDINITSKYYKIKDVYIYDMLSNTVYVEHIDNLNLLSISPNLNKGVYILEVTTLDNIIIRNKIVVQ